MSLREYARKRDFKKTAEPKPALGKSRRSRFVIQKHAASHLHYDFRLEMHGTLKSWAVPKGVPYAKGEKRLAMQVEDHPVGYIDFEGIIPQGQYGGGTVMVWDTGTFELVGPDTLDQGKLHFQLHGKKLEGEWYLVQMRGGKEWLLIRGGDDFKPVSKKQDDTSAVSGHSMAQIARGTDVWQSNKGRGGKKTGAQPLKVKATRAVVSQPAKRPAFIQPMKALLVSAPPKEDHWSYELKFDGYRALAFKQDNQIHLLSANEKDFDAKFPEIVEAVAELPDDDCILDGEVVALDDQGRSSFQLLQSLELREKRPPLFFYAFDLLRWQGRDFCPLPLEKRKAQLETLLKNAPPILRYSATLAGSVADLLDKVRELGLEGLIGKRRGSTYQPGSRSGTWIKLKVIQEQEMVIGGYTPPEGTRKHFGALLLGHYEKRGLVFAGKVGTGFSTALLRELHRRFEPLTQPACPFVNLPEEKASRYGQAITRSEMKRCHWLKPTLVCQVRFSEWTRDGKLRQPVFLGLREDKDAAEVIREKTR